MTSKFLEVFSYDIWQEIGKQTHLLGHKSASMQSKTCSLWNIKANNYDNSLKESNHYNLNFNP